MAGLEDRREALEKKYAYSEEVMFYARKRRNALLGPWAGNRMGYEGADVDAYAKTMITPEIQTATDEEVFNKLRKDFDQAYADKTMADALPDFAIRMIMETMLNAALEEYKYSRFKEELIKKDSSL